MFSTRIPAGVAGGLLAVSLVLTGCGGASTTSPANPAPASPGTAQSGTQPAAQFNDADVAFAQMMIQHHRQAVTMAELATERAQSTEVKTLAEQIRAAQEPEIAQLSGFLNAWGAEVPAGDSMAGMDHGAMPSMAGMPDMAGMMTPAQMEQLRNASGAEFDQMFLTMMIEHHRGAVASAQQEINEGNAPEAKQLAEKIVADQNAEIARMQQLQAG